MVTMECPGPLPSHILQFDRTVLLVGVYLLSGALGLSIFATPDDFVAINVVLYIACQVWNDICELLSIKVPEHANRTGHHRLRLVRDRHLHAGGILHRHQELHVRCLGRH